MVFWRSALVLPLLLFPAMALASGQPALTPVPLTPSPVAPVVSSPALPADPVRSEPLPVPETEKKIEASIEKKEDPKPEPVIPKPLNVMPVKIKPVQDSPDDMAKAAPVSPVLTDTKDDKNLETAVPSGVQIFAGDFWQNTARDEIANFLSLPEAISESRAFRDLTLKTALTPPSSGGLMMIESSKNLYDLRLQRLVNLGDFESALALYKMNEADPPTPIAARAGIEALLGSGQVGVACLEQKALPTTLKTDLPFLWKNIDTLCNVLLGSAVGEDTSLRLTNAAKLYTEAMKPVAPSSAKDINGLDIVSFITLTKAGKFGAAFDNPALIRQLSDKKIGLLLSYGDAVPARQIPLMAEALRRGILSDSKALSQMKDLSSSTIPSPYSALLKEIFATGVPVLSDKVMELADTPPKQLLLLPLLAQPEVAFPEGKKEILLKLLTLANQPIPAPLVKKLYAIAESPEISGKSGEDLLILVLSGKEQSPTLNTLKALGSAAEQQNAIYDNLFSLTGKSNYVMPSADILSSLKESADKKLADQVVVKSLTMLSGTGTEKLNPAALYRILEAFSSVGLIEEKTSLVRYVLGTTLVQ